MYRHLYAWFHVISHKAGTLIAFPAAYLLDVLLSSSLQALPKAPKTSPRHSGSWNSNGSSNYRLIDRSFRGSTSARFSTSVPQVNCIYSVFLSFDCTFLCEVKSYTLFVVRKKNTTPARQKKTLKMVLFSSLVTQNEQAPHFEKQHANGLCCAVTCRIKDPRPGSCDARRKARVYTIYIQSSPNIVNYRRNHLWHSKPSHGPFTAFVAISTPYLRPCSPPATAQSTSRICSSCGASLFHAVGWENTILVILSHLQDLRIW